MSKNRGAAEEKKSVQVTKTPTKATAPGASDAPAKVGAGAQAEMQAPQLSLKEKLKAIYRAQDTLPKLIEDASIPQQRMDEYYVDLQMLVDNGSDKEPIESKDMFSEVGKHKAPNKVLIIGKAGVGKTTFLHHLSYEWGSDKAFADKFDYVFKVKLKKLLTEEARSVLLPLSGEDQLATLIQMSLKDQQAELKARFRTMGEEELARNLERDHIDLADKDAMLETVTSREIKEVLQAGKKGGSQAGKVVLLLDGYDEISHLDVNGNVVSEIMETIYDYQVVLTSRPNAVSGDRAREFDRMIESTGLNNDGALTYIDTYYSKKQAIVDQALTDFYEATPAAENKSASKVISLMIAHFKKQNAENREIFKVLKQIITEQQEKLVEDLPSSSSSAVKSPKAVKVTKTPKSPKAVKTATKVAEVAVSEEKIHGYVDKHYKEVKEALERVLLSNASLQSVVTTPINTAMICLISDDPQVLAGFGEDINAGALYQEVIYWLAKRYTDKDIEAKARVKDLVKEGIFELPEVKALKELACDEFKEGHVIIKGTEFEAHARGHLGNGGIREVNKFGLMRPENAGGNITARSDSSLSPKDQDVDEASDMDDIDADLNMDDMDDVDSDDLVHRDHAFIHLSFQEYLTAHLLKEHLSSHDEAMHQDAAQLIAHHRSEPRYLMSLKFLAGLVSTPTNMHQSRAAEDTGAARNQEGQAQGQELLALRFWDAVTCNVEGLLEFGLDTKVELFMHLLGQVSSRQMEQILSREDALAEKFKLMQELIDVVVLSDFNKWSEVVIASNYISRNIAAVTKKIFQEQDPLAIVNKLGEMLGQSEEDDVGAINPRLQNLLKTALKDIQATSPLKAVQEKVAEFLVQYGARQKEREDHDGETKADSVEAEARISIAGIENLNSGKKVEGDELFVSENPMGVIRQSVRRASLTSSSKKPSDGEEVAENAAKQVNEQELKQAIEVVVSMSNKPEFAWQADAQKLVDAGVEEEKGEKKEEVSGSINISTKEIIFRQLIEQIKTYEQEGTQQNWQMQRVCFQKAQQVMDKSISQEALLDAMKLVIEPRVQLVEAKSTKFFVLDPNLKKVTDSLLFEMLKMVSGCKQPETHASSEPSNPSPAKAEEGLISPLTQYLEIIGRVWAKDSDRKMKEAAGNALAAYMEVAKSSPEILSDDKIGLGQAFAIILELAKDESWEAKQSAGKALGAYMEVAKSSPEILSDDKIGLGQAFAIILELAKDKSSGAKASAGNALAAYMEVAKSSPAILSDDKIGLGQAFAIILELAKHWNDEVRQSAGKALGAYMEVAKSSPEILYDDKIGLGQAFAIILELAREKGEDSSAAKESAGNALGAYMEVAKSSPEILSDDKIGLGQAFAIILELAKDEGGNVRYSAVKALAAYMEVAKSSPEILYDDKIGLGQAFAIIQELAKDEGEYSWAAKQSAVKALGAYMEVAKSSPKILSDDKIGLGQAFAIIQELAKDDHPYAKESAGNALAAYMEVAKSSPKILSDDKIGLGQAFAIIQELAKDEGEYSWAAKQSAVKALGAYMEVAKSSAEILSDDKIGLGQAFAIILELAKDESWQARQSAGNALVAYMEVAKSSPEILYDDKIGLGQAFAIILELAKDSKWQAKQSAVKALAAYMEVAKSSPEILYDDKIGIEQAFAIIQKLAKDRNDDVRASAGNALVAYMEVAKSSPEILSDDKIGLGQALDIILELAKDSSISVRKSAGNALAAYMEVAKSSPAILSDNKIGLEQAFAIILELAKDKTDGYNGGSQIRASAGNALAAYMEVAKSSPEILSDDKIGLGQAFAIILELAKDRDDGVRESAVKALGAYMEVAKSSPEILYDDKIGLGQAFAIILELARTKGDGVRESAGNSLGAYMEVAKSSPEILYDDKIGLGQAFAIILELAKDSSTSVRESAGNALVAYMEVAKSSPEILYDDKIGLGQAFAIILELARTKGDGGRNDISYQVRKSAGNALVAYMEVAKSSPEILSDDKIGLGQAFAIILELAKDENWRARESAVNAVKAMSLEFVVKLDLLHHSDALIRNAAIESIPAKCAELEEGFTLESTVAGFVNSHLDLIRVMLSVIGFESKDDEEHVKAAAASAKKFLELMVNHATEEMQKWVNDNFEDLLREKISSETPSFFKAMLHKALGDGEISELDKEFIIKCIKAGFTTSFTADGKIIFEGKTYDLTGSGVGIDSKSGEGEESKTATSESEETARNHEVIAGNKAALDEIIETAMAQPDLLSVQYREHDPLFPTHDGSLTKPASDFAVVRSLAGGARVVHSDKVIVTLVQPVSAEASDVSGTGGKNASPFDSSQQFILVERRDAFGGLVLDKITEDGTVESIILHPDLMVHKPEAGSAALKQLILGLDADSKPADVLVKYQATTLVVSVVEGRKLLKAAQEVREGASEVKEAEDGDITSSVGTSDGSNTLISFLQESIGEEKVEEHELGKSWDHEVAVYQLIAMELSQEMLQIDSLGRRVDKLDAAFADSIFKDADILQHMIEDHKFQESEKAEIAKISANPYQDAFYKALRMELNSSYLAATTIKSGWVQNNKKGDMGKFGSFMKEVSGVVPFVGPGVNLLGTVLKMADAKHQKSMIDNYATFVVDSAEMAQVAELIARMVVLSNLAIKTKDQSLQSKIKGWLANAADKFATGDLKLLPSDLDEAISMVGDKVIGTVQDKISEVTDVQGQAEAVFAAKKEELMEQAANKLAGIKAASAATAKGKADAKIVAQMIAGKIFAGEFKASDLHAKAAGISEFIGSEFEHRQDASANFAAEEKVDAELVATTDPKIKASKQANSSNGSSSATITDITNKVEKGTSLDQVIASSSKVAQAQEEIAKDIAISVVETLKTLLDADELESASSKREEKFIKDLADSLVSNHVNLLESAKSNAVAKNKVIKQIASSLEASGVGSVSGEKFVLSNQFVKEDDFFEKVLGEVERISSPVTESPMLSSPEKNVHNNSNMVAEKAPPPSGCCTVAFVTEIIHDNELMNHPELLKAASSMGISLDQLIELFSDADVAEEIINNAKEHGAEQVFDIIFGNRASDNNKAGEESANMVTIAATFGTDVESSPLLGGACGLMESTNLG
jgi:HEAT repeat protein